MNFLSDETLVSPLFFLDNNLDNNGYKVIKY